MPILAAESLEEAQIVSAALNNTQCSHLLIKLTSTLIVPKAIALIP
jgi:hypothetical protein